MEKLLDFIKNANEEDLEQLKVVCGLLIYELESMLGENDLEIIEENILEEIRG